MQHVHGQALALQEINQVSRGGVHRILHPEIHAAVEPDRPDLQFDSFAGAGRESRAMNRLLHHAPPPSVTRNWSAKALDVRRCRQRSLCAHVALARAGTHGVLDAIVVLRCRGWDGVGWRGGGGVWCINSPTTSEFGNCELVSFVPTHAGSETCQTFECRPHSTALDRTRGCALGRTRSFRAQHSMASYPRTWRGRLRPAPRRSCAAAAPGARRAAPHSDSPHSAALGRP